MAESVTSINGKIVRMGLPVSTPAIDIVGREHEMNKVLAAWLGSRDDMPMAPLLVGAPGIGKNRIVYSCSRLCDSDLYILQGHEDITAEDLVCAVRISDDRKRQVDYILSPLVSAMITGGICFIDEIGKIRARALAPLAPLLDERRYIDSTILGERVYAHSAFRLVAATNTSDMDQGRLPDFIRSRLKPVITVGNPEQREVEAIISARFAEGIGNAGEELLDHFWDLWRERHQDRPPTPRDSLQIFGYAMKTAEFESIGNERPFSLGRRENTAHLTPEHLRKAFDALHEPSAGG
jgi:MoxR-like ATPase